MNLPEYSLRSAKVIWFFLAVLLAGGALGFATLGKKEDAVFVIKSASLVCSYPGATPQQVEELVTEPIEREVQSMRLVHKITSESYYGLSKILVELDPATRASEIPQLWDELRRKVLNIQPRLPAGASPVTVADDFGDAAADGPGLQGDLKDLVVATPPVEDAEITKTQPLNLQSLLRNMWLISPSR